MTTAGAAWSWVTVAAVRDAAAGIRSITLSCERPVPAAPGTHIDVMVLVEGRTGTRSYSVVRSDPAAGTLEIAVRLAADGGGGSRYLHGLAAGDRLRISEPRQYFPLTRGRPGYVLVAGGIGITPLAPMFRELCAAGADVRLVYAGRDRAAMAFVDQLAGLDRPVQLVVEAEGATIDAAALVAGVPAAHELYVCGPIGLLEALRAAWRAAGRHAAHLRFETFGSSGAHPAEEFVVEVPRLALRTTVAARSTVLDALRAAGAEMMFDCRRGECGLCEVRVLACDGVIDHRDVFLSDAQHAAGDYLCTCVSRVASTSPTGGLSTLVLDLP